MKWFVSIVVLAAIAGGAWWLGSSDSGKEGLEGPGAPRTSGAGTEQAELEGVKPGGESEPARTAMGGAPGAVTNLAGKAAAGNAALSADLRVLVTELATGQAVPGADVWFVDRTDIPATEWQAIWPNGDVKSYVQSHGIHFTAGEDGTVVVPRTENAGLYGSAEGLAGETAWIGQQSSEQVRLGLRPTVDLLVQVIDSYGLPQINVPVGISRNVPGNPTPIIKLLSNGAQATIRFMGLRKKLRNLGPPGYNVHFAFPLPYVERVPFQLESMPADPIILTMPPTGSVMLSILDEDLKPFMKPGHAQLGLMEPNPVTGEVEFSAYATEEIRGGNVFFPRVGVNMNLHLRLIGGRSLRNYEGTLTGPMSDGERIDKEIVWDSRRPRILGRAILADGSALALMTGGFTIFIDGLQGTGGPQVVTDQAGNFELVFPDHYKPGTERIMKVYLHAKDGTNPRDAEIDASFEVSLDGTDVGDVVFTERPMLLSGSVRASDTNELLPRAYVRIEAPDEDGVYHPVPGLMAGTDKGGFFEIYGRVEAEPLRVLVMRNGFLNLTLEPVEAGLTGISLMMERGQETSSPLKGNPFAEGGPGDGKKPK